MLRIVSIAVPMALSLPAWADRISDMPRTELCVYTARLSVAGYHQYLQGKPREAVRIHWHGDETQNEIDFVTRTLDQTYARAAALQAGKQVSEQQFGDMAYEACMTGSES